MLAGCTATLASPGAEAGGPPETAAQRWPFFLGAWQIGKASFAGYWSPSSGALGVETGFRGHEVLLDPLQPSQAIVVARRPGRDLMRIDLSALRPRHQRKIEADRTLNGHAVLSGDGRTLYTSENDTTSGNGLIGVRHADTLAKYAEFPSYGAGPHGLIRVGHELVAANGGVQAIPEVGKGRIQRMDASLALVDLRDGQLKGQWRLDDSFLSIRHIARAPAGVIGVALQAAHATDEERRAAPVLALFDGQSLRIAAGDAAAALNGYAGDVAVVARDGQAFFAVGCTHADRIAWWGSDGRWQGVTPMPSACAVGARDGRLFAATEAGEAAEIRTRDQAISRQQPIGIEWENHLLPFELPPAPA